MSHRQLRNRNISQQPNRMNPIICQKKRKRRQLRKKREAAPVQLEKTDLPGGRAAGRPYTYPMDSTIKVKVEVTPPAGAGYECQWYVKQNGKRYR